MISAFFIMGLICGMCIMSLIHNEISKRDNGKHENGNSL